MDKYERVSAGTVSMDLDTLDTFVYIFMCWWLHKNMFMVPVLQVPYVSYLVSDSKALLSLLQPPV